MEDDTAMELLGSPAAAKTSSLSEGNQPPASSNEPQEQLSHLQIKVEQPDTMGGTIEDQQTRVVYHMEDGEELLRHEQDNEMEEDGGIGSGPINAFVYPYSDDIIAQHLSTPGHQSFTDLNDLLSSKNAAGRGLYSDEKVLEHEKRRVAELKEHMRLIQDELEEVTKRKNTTEVIIVSARANFSSACGVAGISAKLWKEYEAFCESLEPKFGGRGGWSVTCFENHNGSYVSYDSDLDLLVESAEIPLRSHNFRCEATTVKHGDKEEYVVEFWPLHGPKPRAKTAKTWEEQYPKLYKLANQAASDTSRDNTIAKSLLQSLPTHNLPFSGGWLFEYVLETNRTQHPIKSRRWSYRMACKIPAEALGGQQERLDLAAKIKFYKSFGVILTDRSRTGLSAFRS